MKVILLRDVAKVGRRFDVVSVPDGHALNMLIPKGFAQPATPKNVERIQSQKDAAEQSRKESDAEFAEALAKLKESKLTIPVEANELGHMFQALKAEAVVEACKKRGIEVSPNQILFPTPLKEVGEHDIVFASGKEQHNVTVELVTT